MDELNEVQVKIAVLEEERAGIHEKIAPMYARLMEIHDAFRPLCEERDRLRVSGMAEPDWKALVKDLATDGRSSQTLLRYFDQQIRDRFGMWHSGYWGDTNEVNVKVKVERVGDSEKKNVEGVKHFVKFLTPHKDGLVWFGIFEHTLSAGGVFRLKVRPDLKEAVVDRTVYGREQVGEMFDTVEDAVGYIARKHWYGETEDAHEED